MSPIPAFPAAANLQTEFAEGILHVRLNRPEARNAMNLALLTELCALFDALAGRRDVRVVVLRGNGGHFCAGADLKEVFAHGGHAVTDGAVDPVAGFSRRFGTMLRKVAQAGQVVLAVCEGAVLGGGFGLACVSDIAFAKVDARFGLPETTRGLPPAQIAPFVVERIGLTAARKLCLTGAQFDGREALRLGLVHEIYADEAELSAKLNGTIGQVLHCAPQANAMTKAILLNATRADIDTVLDDAAEKFAAAVRGDEAPEGIDAFLHKRRPQWAP
jgi:isohexenylglutaconyl-CoA hydratase